VSRYAITITITITTTITIIITTTITVIVIVIPGPPPLVTTYLHTSHPFRSSIHPPCISYPSR
jgi:hypothetical protein